MILEISNQLREFGVLRENVSLKTISTYRIGGLCSYFIEPFSEESLVSLIHYLTTSNIPYKVIGNASNMLISDDEYEGVIIRLRKGFDAIERTDTGLMVGAGVHLVSLAHQSAQLNLTGLEFVSGIPGSVGGALYMNAGAYQKSIYDCINRIRIFDGSTVRWISRNDVEASYRFSSFMTHPKWVVLSAEFTLDLGDRSQSEAMMKERLQRRLQSQPLEFPSCGSVFRNPDGHFAWEYIEGVEMRGVSAGDAQVSEKHANFIVNKGHATAHDVRILIEQIQLKVWDKYHLHLHPEVEFFNFHDH